MGFSNRLGVQYKGFWKPPPVVSGGAAPWSPTDITGLQLWLDFSDISTLYQDSGKTTPVTADGDVIGAAVDKSGSGNDATQGTTGSKPTYKTNIKNSLSIARFVTDDFLSANSLATTFSGNDKPMSAFVIYERDGLNNDMIYAFGKASSSTPLFEMFLPGSGYQPGQRRDDASTLKNPVVGTSTTNYELNQFLFTGTIGKLYINGSAVDENIDLDVGTITLDLFDIGQRARGTSYTINGDIAELIIYDTALSDENRQVVRDYLNAKWSIY